jgi:hypothetical protein
MSLDKITKLGRYFLAIPMVVFGNSTFLVCGVYCSLGTNLGSWTFIWTYFAGVALFRVGSWNNHQCSIETGCHALGVDDFDLGDYPSHSACFQFPGDSEFINVFDALCILSGAYLLSLSLPGPLPGKVLEKIARRAAKISPYLILVSLTVFGIENFIHSNLVFIVGAPAYEVPGEAFWVYFTSIDFYRPPSVFFFPKEWDHHSFVGHLHFFHCDYILRSAALGKYL